jgi:hypothetical protein
MIPNFDPEIPLSPESIGVFNALLPLDPCQKTFLLRYNGGDGYSKLRMMNNRVISTEMSEDEHNRNDDDDLIVYLVEDDLSSPREVNQIELSGSYSWQTALDGLGEERREDLYDHLAAHLGLGIRVSHWIY